MPFCPSCKVEYRSGFTRCTDCGVDLVPALPANATPSAGAGPVELVEVANFPNASEAEMIQELLEENGISTVLRGDVDPLGIVAGSTIITLLVNSSDLEAAKSLYEGYFAGNVEGEQQPAADEEEDDPDRQAPTSSNDRT